MSKPSPFNPWALVTCHCGSGRKRGWWKPHCRACERTCTDDRFKPEPKPMKHHTFKCSGCNREDTLASPLWHEAWADQKSKGWRCSKVGERWHQWCPDCPIRDSLEPVVTRASEDERKRHVESMKAQLERAGFDFSTSKLRRFKPANPTA